MLDKVKLKFQVLKLHNLTSNMLNCSKKKKRECLNKFSWKNSPSSFRLIPTEYSRNIHTIAGLKPLIHKCLFNNQQICKKKRRKKNDKVFI